MNKIYEVKEDYYINLEYIISIQLIVQPIVFLGGESVDVYEIHIQSYKVDSIVIKNIKPEHFNKLLDAWKEYTNSNNIKVNNN